MVVRPSTVFQANRLTLLVTMRSILTSSMMQNEKPPPSHNAKKRPDFKGFHGFTGLSGKAVKARSLYEDFA